VACLDLRAESRVDVDAALLRYTNRDEEVSFRVRLAQRVGGPVAISDRERLDVAVGSLNNRGQLAGSSVAVWLRRHSFNEYALMLLSRKVAMRFYAR